MPLHISSKDFEILDLDPPNNPTSHDGACHFGYNHALMTSGFATTHFSGFKLLLDGFAP